MWPPVPFSAEWKLLKTGIDEIRRRVLAGSDERFEAEPDGSHVLVFFTSVWSIIDFGIGEAPSPPNEDVCTI